MARKRWEAQLVAAAMMGVGSARAAPAATGHVSEPRNADRVSADTFMGMMGMKT